MASPTLLATGLDQLAGLIAQVGPDDLARPTPCTEWTVGELVEHVVASTGRFAEMARGEQPDWAAAAPPVGDDPAAAFATKHEQVLEAFGAAEGAPEAMPLAELSVHTYDLATALGRPTADLDGAPAEAGLEFMRSNLSDELRGDSFGPEQAAPDGADAYQRIAAFAGRSVG